MIYGDPRWRLATLDCKPRQARKGATVVVDAGAEGTLAGVASNLVCVVGGLGASEVRTFTPWGCLEISVGYARRLG